MILCENLFGQKLWVSPESAGAFRRHGGFDTPALCLIEYLATALPSPVAVDVGANIGNHTVVLAKFCDHVTSFEPRLNFDDTLRKNVALNGLENCTLVAAGLSDAARVAPIFVSESAEGGTTTFVRSLASVIGKSVDVPLFVGDEYIEAHGLERLDIVKVDVEGMEANVVTGMMRSIRRFQPIVLMEWNNAITRAAFLENAIFERIFGGYTIVGIRGKDARELFARNAIGWLGRKIARLNGARGFVRVPFNPNESYETIMLVPKRRIELAGGT